MLEKGEKKKFSLEDKKEKRLAIFGVDKSVLGDRNMP